MTRAAHRFPQLSSPTTAPRRSAAPVRVAIVLAAILCCTFAGVGFARASQAAAGQQPAGTPAVEQAAAHASEGSPQGEPSKLGAEPAKEGGQEAAAHGEAEQGEGEQAESPWAWVARLVNFVLLAGGLFYLLRSPLAGFLEQRGTAVRSDLANAAELKKEASAQIAQIDAKMAALPSEIEALKRRGAEEIAAEEARIHALAETERKRLLEQARREIDTQLRVAERDLKKRAGELAVAVATERVKRTITEQDQARLVDRYVSQVRH